MFLPRESHGQKSLVGYNQWGHKESDMTQRLNNNNNNNNNNLMKQYSLKLCAKMYDFWEKINFIYFPFIY